MPSLVPLETLAVAIAHAIGPFCTSPVVARDVANNAVQALMDPDPGTQPRVAIAESLWARRGDVRHLGKAAEIGERAYLVAERPTTQMRLAMLEHLGVADGYAWLREHGLWSWPMSGVQKRAEVCA